MYRLIADSEDYKQLTSIILNHPVCRSLNRIEDIHIFMKHHSFAVYDFMLLAKRLQADLSGGTNGNWYPPKYPKLANFINSIIVEEESDPAYAGKSHFQWYIDAMKECGAPYERVQAFAMQNANGFIVATDSESLDLYTHSLEVKNLVDTGTTSEITAVFALSRESLVPPLFVNIVKAIELKHPGHFTKLIDYMKHHIAIDANEHGPMSINMVDQLCTDDVYGLTEIVCKFLNLRIDILDRVYAEIKRG